MKKAVYKKIDEKIEKVTIRHEATVDDFGVVIEAYDEVIDKVIPVMGVVYEEMTKEEILSLENEVSDKVEPTLEERLEAMESAMLEMIMGGAL